MSDKTKKPGNKIGREDSCGQNPFWPGEGAREAGENITDKVHDEKTTIPFVDSVPHKRNTTT